jgi:hypothetical protein
MIAGRVLAISSDLFSNVGVGDFLDLHFQLPPRNTRPKSK